MKTQAKILVTAGIVFAMVFAPTAANETSNCAQLKADIFADPAGGGENWRWFTSNWVSGSSSNYALYVDQKPSTSRHWGRKTTGGASDYITRAF